jgi:hypothetical protein
MLLLTFGIIIGIFGCMWWLAGVLASGAVSMMANASRQNISGQVSPHAHLIYNPATVVLMQIVFFMIEILIFSACGNSLSHH